jgi:hypothetical protein
MKRFLKPHGGSPVKIIRNVQIVCVMDDEDPDADIEFHWFIEPEGFVFEDRLSGADDQILDMHGPFATEAEAVANVRLVLPNVIEEPPGGDKLQ